MSRTTHALDARPRSEASRTVLSIWSWFALGVILLVWLPLVVIVRVVSAPFDRGRYLTGYVFRRSAVLHHLVNPMWRFHRGGTLPDDMRNPYVVVANHQSFVDMLLISQLPFEMKWMAKRSLFKIPVAGWMMHLSGDILLKRGDRASGATALGRCHQVLRRRISVMIFPEGTRSEDGSVGAFKDGAFRLAIEAGVPVLPLVIDGADTALRKSDWRLGDAQAVVRVLAPVPTDGMTESDIPALRELVRGRIVAELETLRNERSGGL
jgi:1-acyl-sn-glycerol-3-phosphate acyltransferase